MAERLRGLRRDAGRTQVWLAQRATMSQTKLSNIETGRVTPGPVDVELILRALDTPPCGGAPLGWAVSCGRCRSRGAVRLAEGAALGRAAPSARLSAVRGSGGGGVSSGASS
ncbi:helix-turn-helix transcriptional regulator [Streptomyces sp. NPDC093252]|uniref:helix-turn-helix domain-containing protein n=1 Tax=Streptomyces sp. NPDC093252 TaxID=3154980 RepID=UPI00343DD4D3